MKITRRSNNPDPQYIVGLDLGKEKDFSAIVVVKRLINEDGTHSYVVTHEPETYIEKKYSFVEERVRNIVSQLPYGTRLVIDKTGIGSRVIEEFESLKPISVWLTGGHSSNHDGDNWNCAECDLVDALAVVIENGRLRSVPGPKAEELVNQLLTFRSRISARTAHKSFGSATEKDHDDLAFALMFAVWFGEDPTTQKDRNGRIEYRGTTPGAINLVNGRVPPAYKPVDADGLLYAEGIQVPPTGASEEAKQASHEAYTHRPPPKQAPVSSIEKMTRGAFDYHPPTQQSAPATYIPPTPPHQQSDSIRAARDDMAQSFHRKPTSTPTPARSPGLDYHPPPAYSPPATYSPPAPMYPQSDAVRSARDDMENAYRRSRK